MPIWLKNAYRMQLMYPIPHPTATGIGQSGIIWTPAKNPQMIGDNFNIYYLKK